MIQFDERGSIWIDLQKERHETRLRLKRALTEEEQAGCDISMSQGLERGENNTMTRTKMTGALNGASKGEHKTHGTYTHTHT